MAIHEVQRGSKMSPNSDSKTVEEAWLEYRHFWNKYVEHLREMGINSYDDLKKKANEIIGEGDPTRDRVEQALKLVVHPDDYECLLEHIKDEDDLKLFTMTLLSKVNYDEACEDELCIDPMAEARPVIPEPFYGDPLNARIIAIYNNPGFNALLLDVHKIKVNRKWERRYTEKETIVNEIERQRRNFLQLTFGEGDAIQNIIYPWTQSANPPAKSCTEWMESEPKFASFDWHAKNIYNTSQSTRALYLAAAVGKIGLDSYDKRALFQLDFFPYQSEDGKAAGVNDILKLNKRNEFLSSQIVQMDLVAALKNDSRAWRLIIFRSKSRIEIFEKYLFNNFSKGVMSSGGQTPALTLGNVRPSEEMLYAYLRTLRNRRLD